MVMAWKDFETHKGEGVSWEAFGLTGVFQPGSVYGLLREKPPAKKPG